MAKIRMLSDDLIGKIAAGEVVERPAAAIKELVENSLDAGATRITVEIEEGGITSFRVTDDGSGIDESDIRMAFERHATSKIRSEADLDAIGTLGFRGEALASIAAVGRVTLTTRTRERETGLRVKNEGGQIVDMSEAACAPGTSILVKELFFNVPVRKGFLKKPVTETNAITDLMTRLILSRPDVSFRYVSNGKTIYHSPGDGKIESAILAIYGSQVVRTMRKAEGHQGGVVIRGYVGIGENARNNRGGESFFINGRMMRSPLLSGALEDGCRERVMIGKFPICVLYLEMPYENVNVNVHPNKMEVRFRFDQQVRDAVYTIVKEALQDRDAFQRPVPMTLQEKQASELPEIAVPKQSGIPQLPVSAQVEVGTSVPAIKFREAPVTPVYRPIEAKEAIKPAAMEEIQPEPALPPLQLSQSPKTVSQASETRDPIQEEKKTSPFDEPVSQTEEKQKDPWREELSREAFTAEVPVEAPAAQVVQEDFLPTDLPKPMKIFGAVFNTFILIEYADHLLLVDQHAVHERLLFERMMKAYEEDRAGQEMLVPYIVPVTQKDMAILEEYRELLEEIGLTVEPFSANEVAIRSVPITLGQQESADFLHEAIDELENGRIPGADKKRAAILQQACKHAVKGGEPLTDDILRSLVEEMIEKKVTPTCPHGRPLVVSISHRELDKKFKRIQ
ncbi:MAG: DNA mismatch repair endonuclease MutL [Clostridia bacterium]|nr:DNA mismatch repair endonuclease MutL [Clostridia bacterium]